MVNTLDPASVEIWENGTRICRSCGFELPADPERAPDHWYITKAGRLSGYCKECTKRKVVECRRDRKAGVPKLRAECSICGLVRKINWEGDVAVCTVCDVAVRAAEGEIKLALENLAWIHGHNVEVEARREGHNSNKVFIPHPDWIFESAPYYDHRDCVRAEVSARAVVRYLARSVGDHR